MPRQFAAIELLGMFNDSAACITEGYTIFISRHLTLLAERLSPPNFPLLPFVTMIFKTSKAWRLFSWAVHHSKFSGKLFSLLPSIWLTYFLLCGFCTKALATSLCTVLWIGFRRVPIVTARYCPLKYWFISFPGKNRTRPRLLRIYLSIVRIFAVLLTSQNCSYPRIGFQISAINEKWENDYLTIAHPLKAIIHSHRCCEITSMARKLKYKTIL